MKQRKPFLQWLNEWAKFNDRPECISGDKITEFGKGYKKAISDVYERVKYD